MPLPTDHLTLRLLRLKRPAEWVVKGECLSFVFPTSGEGRHIYQDRTDDLGPGQVLVLGVSSNGRLSTTARAELLFWQFSTSLEHILPLLAGRQLSLLANMAAGLRVPRLYPAGSSVASACHALLAEAPPAGDSDHRGHLLRIVGHILASEFQPCKSTPGGEETQRDENVTTIMDQLTVEEILELSVIELARRFGCTPRHLNRLFHRHFGSSVSAFKMELRLLRSAALLRDPNAKVISVAEECGFNFVSQFNARFKRRFGVSPGQWRRQGLAAAGTRKPAAELDSSCRMLNVGLCPWCASATDPVNGNGSE